MNVKLLKNIAKILILSALVILFFGIIEIIQGFKLTQSYSDLGVNLWVVGITIGLTGSILLFASTLLKFKNINKKTK